MRSIPYSAIATPAILATTVTALAADFYALDGNPLIEGISDNGVGCGVGGFGGQYFMWTAEGGLQGIGGTEPGNGIGGQGKISEDGSRICGTYLNPESSLHEMSYYDVAGGAWVPCGGIGDACSSETSSGWNISGDGTTVVGLGWLTCADAHAATWQEGSGNADLGSTYLNESSRANGVDYDGNVVVGWQDGNGRQGAVWVDGVQELIFKGDGMPAREAFDVSGDGQWVTGLDIGGFFGPPGQMYRYNTVTNVHESLPNLATGGESRMAGSAITDDGTTIVGGTWPLGPATLGTAVIWREGIGTIRFDDYLDSLGVEYPDGFNFALAAAMSSDGKWIAGWGTQSWVVYLGSDCASDTNGDDMVDVDDLVAVILSWGTDDAAADVNDDGAVDVDDLVQVVLDWGPC